MKQFKVGDVVTSSAAGRPEYTYTVIEANDLNVTVRYDGDGLGHSYIVNKEQWEFLSVKSSGPIVGPNGEHDCEEHLESAKGFRFDYHYCKLCGSKQHTA